jgi:spore maturation protein CgeB
MKFVVLGHTISSSWGNGHATLPRGSFRALVERRHQIAFFDVPYYAAHRDLSEMPGVTPHLRADRDEASALSSQALLTRMPEWLLPTTLTLLPHPNPFYLQERPYASFMTLTRQSHSTLCALANLSLTSAPDGCAILISFVQHVPPLMHPAFYCSSQMTLNVTRPAMSEMGYCPSGRLFDDAACGEPLLSNEWEGLEQFFSPGAEVIIIRSTEDTLDALATSRQGLTRIAQRARKRTLEGHTSDRRATGLEAILNDAYRPQADATSNSRSQRLRPPVEF